MPRPFQSDLVIDERICEPALKAYHVGFDNNKFRFLPLIDVIRRVIPEFSLGYHEGKGFSLTVMVDRLKEAADTVYQTDKYQKRGEFGELILHLLLRDFQNSIPLVSKIYFKDSHDVPVHGFDGVHVTINGEEKKLWLGESKMFKTGKRGIQDLAKDIHKHVNEDYIRKEFALVSRKLPVEVPEIDYWRNLMDKHQRAQTIFSSLVIPMVCTYTSNLFNKHTDETVDYFQEFENECKYLCSEFDKLKLKLTIPNNVEIILMLLPVPCKNELNKELNKRLKAMQSI
ncbi:HamA C-terminal domain-containing protein [Hymenobacter edaphi]|uniref:DUF1837 domain-containing protein n=1 Tax=Hymenobacter edaphi TaxID=2211146 RepID=A0A328BU30_9BACT|nr:DUF1837 domain-containing protein [Hymenobacter edaphi]RAK70563.1 DUF1837 domain-containing protein [Hymenobacter edaphi]